MHLNIKNNEAHRLAVDLSRLTGESLTAAVTTAIKERLERERRRTGREGVAERIMELSRRYAHVPNIEGADPDEILGYDENGLPT